MATMWVSPRTNRLGRVEWTVKWENEDNISRVFGTKQEAKDYANEHAGVVKIQRMDGTIEQ